MIDDYSKSTIKIKVYFRERKEKKKRRWLGFYTNKNYYNILPPNQNRCPICLGTVIKNGVGSIKKGK